MTTFQANTEGGDTSEIMETRETARLIGVAPETLCRWRRSKLGPPYRQVGKTVRYSRPVVLKWLEGESAV